MPPLEDHHRWATVHFLDLPGKGRHHTLECLVAGLEVVVDGVIVRARRQEGIVGANLEHMFSGLGFTTVQREAVGFAIDGPPIIEGGLEGGFDFPVLHEFLN